MSVTQSNRPSCQTIMKGSMRSRDILSGLSHAKEWEAVLISVLPRRCGGRCTFKIEGKRVFRQRIFMK